MVPDNEEKLLQEALTIVKGQALEMKLSLDKGNLMDALKQASIMLGELRTSLLSPKNYYELYIVISDQLKHLELYLYEEYNKGHTEVPDLYELVQYFGNIIPRLYLLITVGLIYMQTNRSMKQSLLRDLVEMCRGVQHPLRGLFLRNYLLQCVRSILPNVIQGDSSEGTVKDSIDFILMNFGEMNKLWVRMQHQGHSRDREKREKEREELRLLVGTNLVRLSQLDSITVEKYSKMVLPGILEQVVSCRDVIAQEYLMECIIRVFPDEFHLATLNPFLKSCAELQPEVNVKQIVTILVERLAAYCNRQDSDDALLTQLFEIFSNHIASIIQCRDMKMEDIVSLEVSLANLALTCYPDKKEYVDQVLLSTRQIFDKLQINKVGVCDSVYRELMQLLCLPVQSYNNILVLIELKNYTGLVHLFDVTGRKAIAANIINNALNNNTLVETPQQVDSILGMAGALISNSDEDDNRLDIEPEDYNEEQTLLARFVHQLKTEVLDQQFLILSRAKKHLQKGGNPGIRYTYPALVFQAYQLAFKYAQVKELDDLWEKKCNKIVEFCLQTILALNKAEYSELALKLFLHGTLAIGQIKFTNCEDTAYEFLTQGFTIYEERLTEDAGCLMLVMSCFSQLDCFSQSNSEPVLNQCFRYASHVPHSPAPLLACAHLFWSSRTSENKQMRNAKRVVDCLDKVGKLVASTASNDSTKATLLLDLLNHYLYFYEQGNTLITMEKVNKLIRAIKAKLKTLKFTEEVENVQKYLANTLEHIRDREQSPESDLYQGIAL